MLMFKEIGRFLLFWKWYFIFCDLTFSPERPSFVRAWNEVYLRLVSILLSVDLIGNLCAHFLLFYCLLLFSYVCCKSFSVWPQISVVEE